MPENELILSTLLEWGSDLDDVKFYLRPREDTPSYSQVVTSSYSQVVNGKIQLNSVHFTLYPFYSNTLLILTPTILYVDTHSPGNVGTHLM